MFQAFDTMKYVEHFVRGNPLENTKLNIDLLYVLDFSSFRQR